MIENIDNLKFDDLPRVVAMLVNTVEEMKQEIREIKQNRQGDTELILARFHKGEIITPDDPRLVGLITKSMIYRRSENNCPFHKNGGKLYTTPEELEVWLNPHREAMKQFEANTSRRSGRKPFQIPVFNN